MACLTSCDCFPESLSFQLVYAQTLLAGYVLTTPQTHAFGDGRKESHCQGNRMTHVPFISFHFAGFFSQVVC